MYGNGEIIQKLQKMAIQYSQAEVDEIRVTHGQDFIVGHVIMATMDAFIVNTIEDILNMVDGEEDASVNELLSMHGSKMINPRDHGKFVSQADKLNIHMLREDPEQFDPIFARHCPSSVIIDSDYYVFERVNKGNLYLIDDNVLGNLYFFKRYNYETKIDGDQRKVSFEVEVEIFKTWLDQIKKFVIK